MSQVILDNIPFQPDVAILQQELRLRPDNRRVDDLQRLVRDAQAVARPKALYKAARVESKGDDHVIIDSVRFNSRVLRVNRDQAEWVFPHVVTCGRELHDWADSIDDVMQRYWADAISRKALRAASHALRKYLAEHHLPGQISCVSPGVFPEWPLSGQRALFEVLDGPQEAIGVRLLKSCMMEPHKSTSGIIYSSEECFVICELCATEHCAGRSAPYDETLYEREYQLHS